VLKKLTIKKLVPKYVCMLLTNGFQKFRLFLANSQQSLPHMYLITILIRNKLFFYVLNLLKTTDS